MRDYMLSQFTKQSSSILRNQSELESVKFKLVTDFSRNLIQVFSTYSLKTQIIRHFDGIQVSVQNSSFKSIHCHLFFSVYAMHVHVHVAKLINSFLFINGARLSVAW